MANALITAQFVPATSFVVETTGGGGASSTWTAGVAYPTVAAVLAKLNADLTGHVAFGWTPATGEITVTWTVTPNTLTWNSAALQAFLGFDDAVLTQATDDNDGPPLGWWYGQTLTPWGATRKFVTTDVASDYGRTVASEYTGTMEEGSVVLWLHKRQTADFVATMTDAYAVADEWAANPLSLTDAQGNVLRMVVAPGWECAPQLLDPETVTLEVEAVAWPA